MMKKLLAILLSSAILVSVHAQAAPSVPKEKFVFSASSSNAVACPTFSPMIYSYVVDPKQNKTTSVDSENGYDTLVLSDSSSSFGKNKTIHTFTNEITGQDLPAILLYGVYKDGVPDSAGVWTLHIDKDTEEATCTGTFVSMPI